MCNAQSLRVPAAQHAKGGNKSQNELIPPDSPRFDEKEILGLRVPKAVAYVQDKLAELVKQSIAARREARRLLDEAKALVEKAILSGNAGAL